MQNVRSRFDDPNRIPITEASQKLFEIVREVISMNTRKLITRNGRAVVAILPLGELAMLDDLVKSVSPDNRP